MMQQEQEKEMLRTFIVAKASTLDTTNQEKVEAYNNLVEKLMDLEYPGREKEKAKTKADMEKIYTQLFRGPDGKPREIKMKAGDSDAEVGAGPKLKNDLLKYRNGRTRS
jgi:hypothetical protein